MSNTFYIKNIKFELSLRYKGQSYHYAKEYKLWIFKKDYLMNTELINSSLISFYNFLLHLSSFPSVFIKLLRISLVNIKITKNFYFLY